MNSIGVLQKEAIEAAGDRNWPKAIKANLSILQLQPKDTPALLRLAWAYATQGKPRLAKINYKKVLAIDKYNLIANKNLKRLNKIKKRPTTEDILPKKIAFSFLEESGKTKVVSLVRLAPPEFLSSLQCAEPVKLLVKKRRISVRDTDNRYLGILPDDVSFRLLKLIKGGNQYQAWIKKVEKNSLRIFIRETKRVSKFKNLPSFPLRK